jgi:hypothetical protein
MWWDMRSRVYDLGFGAGVATRRDTFVLGSSVSGLGIGNGGSGIGGCGLGFGVWGLRLTIMG